jgi:hypothetical protein
MILACQEAWKNPPTTQYVKEMKYLASIGIMYTFVKEVNGITTYKYLKNSKLFKALAIFYEQFDK